jgi:hypothetical protein
MKNPVIVYENKKFCEELPITDRTENNASNSSVAVFVATETCLPSHCVAKIRETCTHGESRPVTEELLEWAFSSEV